MVNTFLPFADFKASAECLDYKRLGCQRKEAHQILGVLANPDAKGWKNHPAVRMWRGYDDALKAYFNAVVTEWVRRGYKNNYTLFELPEKVEYPWWFGHGDFHFSHQAALVRKLASHYESKFDELDPKYRELGYAWPKVDVVVTFNVKTKRAVRKERQLLRFAPLKTA
jgi:hypothetical protein